MKKKSDKSDSQQLISFRFVDADRVQDPLKLKVFIDWIVLPSKLRVPKTQKLFAKQIGVNQDTLTDWKKLNGFWNEVKQEQQHHFQEQVSDVLYGLTKRAKEGNPVAVKLFLQYFCGFSEKQTFKEEPSRELTKEQEEELTASLKRWKLMTGGAIPSMQKQA